MQTSAFLNGRKTVDMSDILILIHCLWNKTETIPTIIDAVCKSLTSDIDKKLDKFEKEIEQALKQKSSSVSKETSEKNQPTMYTLIHFFYYSIRDFPDGKCLFYKADYDHLSIDKPIDGIIYYDESKKSWIVHAIYTGAPFDNNIKNASNVRKVNLNKCLGGIIIDGVPYGFKTQQGSISSTNGEMGKDIFAISNVASTIMEMISRQIRPQFADLQDLFTKSKNIFLSDDDIKLSKKYLSICDKRINEVSMKVQNAQKLL